MLTKASMDGLTKVACALSCAFLKLDIISSASTEFNMRRKTIFL